MLKRLLLFSTSVVLLLSSFSFNTLAEEYQVVNLLINGEVIDSDQPAVIYNNRTIVPIRIISENLNCNVEWMDDIKTVVITSNDKTNYYVQMTVGSNKLIIFSDGETTSSEIDMAPVIINNRVMIPVSAVAELFGYTALWDAETKTANFVNSISDTNEAEYNTDVSNITDNTYSNDAAVKQLYLDSYNKIYNSYIEAVDELEKYSNSLTAYFEQNKNSLHDTKLHNKYNDYIKSEQELYQKAETLISDEIRNNPTDADVSALRSITSLLKDLIVKEKSFAESLNVSVDLENTTSTDTTGENANVKIITAEKNTETTTASETKTSTVEYSVSKVSSGEYNILKGIDNGEAISDDKKFTILKMVKSYTDILSGKTSSMSKDIYNIFESEYTYCIECLRKSTDEIYDSDVMSLYECVCDFETIAEIMNVSINSDMKEYAIVITNPVYSSSDLSTVVAAVEEASDKFDTNYQHISRFKSTFKQSQLIEYNRIINPVSYYTIQYSSDDRGINYYKGLLKVYDKSNERLKKFGLKYSIQLY